jgi:hypothetical protein
MADRMGVQQSFHYLLYGFLVTLPLLSWLFLRNISQGEKGRT